MGGRPRGLILNLSFLCRPGSAQFCAAAVLVERLSSRSPSMDFVRHYASDEIGSYPMAPTLADHGGLRPTVPRRLLACMPAKKPPISLSPRSLEPGPPELGTPDFTEIRNVPRSFPENAAERACYQYLLQQMQAAPDGPHRRKDEFEEICRRRFHVTVDSFDYCWREANKVTNAGWDQPGRPSREKRSR